MTKTTILTFLGLFLIAFIPFRHLFLPGYFPIDDNTQIMRIYQLEKCLQDGQFPCRLVPDMGNGYTFPLFNYYSPLVYYLGVFGRLFGLSYIFIVKTLFFLSVFLSALTFYYLTSKIFKLSLSASFIGTLLYILAPYRSVDIYVRGDLAESWVFVFLPLIIGIIYNLAYQNKINKKTLLVYNFILAGFFTVHTVSLITLFIPLIIWTLYLFIKTPNRLRFFYRLLWLLPSLGISSFYLVPAILEKNLVTVETMFTDYFNYANHFVSIKQLFFSRFWGYGGSNVLDNDTMSFQLGLPHWWLAIPVAFLIGLKLITIIQKRYSGLGPAPTQRGFISDFGFRISDLFNKIYPKPYLFNLGLITIFLYGVSIFLTHAKSYPVWQILPFLRYLQFPWRFLLPAIFFQALIGSFLVQFIINLKIKPIYKYLTLTIIATLTLILNLGFFKPETIWPNFTDQTFFQKDYFTKQQQAIIHDYLPKTVKILPKPNQFKQPVLKAGKGQIKDWQLRSNYWQFITEVDKKAVIMVPVFDYLTWQVVINGQPSPHQIDKDYGFITVDITGNGKYIVQGFFTTTKPRQIANTITILSLIPLIFLAL